MPDAITYAQISAFVTFSGVVLGLWIRIEHRARSIDKDLQAYKLEVAKSLASKNHVQDVEQKMLKRLDDLLAEFRELRHLLTKG